jgi:hypothetical protein
MFLVEKLMIETPVNIEVDAGFEVGLTCRRCDKKVFNQKSTISN